MGFPCYTISVTNHHYSPVKALQDYIFSHLVRSSNIHTSHELTTIFQASPSLVPLPIHLMIKSMKDHLTILEYATIRSRLSTQEDEYEDENVDAFCAVCLSKIKGCHKVRELCHCEHVFHVECIDGWIDQGRGTCPICRAKVSSGGHGSDPWRSERMIYLFGEDCLVEELE